MEEAEYNITNKEFKQIRKWTENIYNIAAIVDYRLVVVGDKCVCVFCFCDFCKITVGLRKTHKEFENFIILFV